MVELHGFDVSWRLAELAYAAYSARHGAEQSLARMAQRGGFGLAELAFFVLDALGYECDMRKQTVGPPKRPQRSPFSLQAFARED